MNKDSIILDGWLVKSPPNKKTWFRAVSILRFNFYPGMDVAESASRIIRS